MIDPDGDGGLVLCPACKGRHFEAEVRELPMGFCRVETACGTCDDGTVTRCEARLYYEGREPLA